MEYFKKIKSKLKRSKLYSLNKRDFFNGLLLAAFSSALYFIQESAAQKEMLFDWQGIGMAAVGGMSGYLIKNFFTPGEQDLQRKTK